MVRDGRSETQLVFFFFFSPHILLFVVVVVFSVSYDTYVFISRTKIKRQRCTAVFRTVVYIVQLQQSAL